MFKNVKWFGYIHSNITVLFLIDSAGCDLFHRLRLPYHFVHHLLPPLWKCNNDRGHTHEYPDLWLLDSPDLNPVDYKISGIIQQWVHQTKVRDVNDLSQHLTDVWAELEQSVIDDGKCLHACIQVTGGHLNIHHDIN